jgi:hypothetical protein
VSEEFPLFSIAAPDVYREFEQLLAPRAFSSALYVPTEDECARIEASLRTARIARRCGCGQTDCETHDFQTLAADDGTTSRTVRFHVRGEAAMRINAAGIALSVERLVDETPVVVYEALPDGTTRMVDLR